MITILSKREDREVEQRMQRLGYKGCLNAYLRERVCWPEEANNFINRYRLMSNDN